MVVAERVVDLLEAVEVHQQHGNAARPSRSAADRLADAIAEQGAVGQTGQGVVQRLVAVELGLPAQRGLGAVAVLLGQHLVGDVEQDAVEPQPLAGLAQDRAAPLGDPAQTAVGVEHAVLDGIGCPDLERPVDLLGHVRAIVGVDD